MRLRRRLKLYLTGRESLRARSELKALACRIGTDRVRADSGLPHVGLLRAQVRNLHSQPIRQGLHVTCQPAQRERQENETFHHTGKEICNFSSVTQ